MSVPKEDIASPTVQSVIDSLLATAHGAGGLGLAAPQIGESLRIFVMRKPAREVGGRARRRHKTKSMEWIPVVNPTITAWTPEQEMWLEGCLSMPDYAALVRRKRSVKVKYMTRAGEITSAELAGLPSCVFQHELDHLDGILTIDRELQLSDAARERAWIEAEHRMLRGMEHWYNEAPAAGRSYELPQNIELR